MKAEQTVLQKARDLKSKYGSEKAIEILTADSNRYGKNKEYRKKEECDMAIRDIRSNRI